MIKAILLAFMTFGSNYGHNSDQPYNVLVSGDTLLLWYNEAGNDTLVSYTEFECYNNRWYVDTTLVKSETVHITLQPTWTTGRILTKRIKPRVLVKSNQFQHTRLQTGPDCWTVSPFQLNLSLEESILLYKALTGQTREFSGSLGVYGGHDVLEVLSWISTKQSPMAPMKLQ